MMIEKRILKLSFNKGGSGSVTPRLNLPARWARDMGLTQESRDVEVVYDEEKKEIIIKKKL